MYYFIKHRRLKNSKTDIRKMEISSTKMRLKNSKNNYNKSLENTLSKGKFGKGK